MMHASHSLGAGDGSDDNAQNFILECPTSSQQVLPNPNLLNEKPEKEIFLCSDCYIAFQTKDDCSKHMSKIHNVTNFNFSEVELHEEKVETIEEPNRELKFPDAQSESHEVVEQTSVIGTRKVKPPFKYTPEGGNAVPKRFGVYKDSHLYKCSSCTNKFESKEVRQVHQDCHAHVASNGSVSKGFLCTICEGLRIKKGTETISPDQEESASNYDDSLFSTNYPNWSKCAWHLWKVHNIDCELSCCTYQGCGFKSYFMNKVREHESIHSELHQYKCTICHKVFKQLKQLRTHEKYHTTKNTALPPPGESRWYTTKECQICKRVLSDSKCLKKHVAAVHNKLKPHSCNICGHRSARKHELQLHMRQHTGDKPYNCKFRGCTFATGDHNSLRNHALTHSDMKRYSCKFCPFKCIQSSGFKKHIIARHPEEGLSSIFTCPHCPFISVNTELYENHVKDHEDGRLPIQDMLTDKEPSTAQERPKGRRRDDMSFVNLQVDDSSSNSNNSSGAKRSTSRFWTRDEDSLVDVVDTGGITIPAQATITLD